MEIKGALPGQYACELSISRRNSTLLKLTEAPILLAHIRKLANKAAPRVRINDNTVAYELTAGVKLNGHQYKRGDRSTNTTNTL
jgi:hypothetical protein